MRSIVCITYSFMPFFNYFQSNGCNFSLGRVFQFFSLISKSFSASLAANRKTKPIKMFLTSHYTFPLKQFLDKSYLNRILSFSLFYFWTPLLLLSLKTTLIFSFPLSCATKPTALDRESAGLESRSMEDTNTEGESVREREREGETGRERERDGGWRE